jgi:two-component system NtrC family sensor kinase
VQLGGSRRPWTTTGPSLLKKTGRALRVITTGTERVTKSVRSLRNFARLDEAEMQRTNVHEGLDSILTLVHHKLKDRIEVVKAYGEIPEIVCFPSRQNQVFLNILTNAAQAIPEEGTIRIRTDVDEPNAVIEISDTGRGMAEVHLQHIFESGFTTKPAGQGKGLGLAISKQIVTDHGGEISVTSVVGQGTVFWIQLPLEGKGEL